MVGAVDVSVYLCAGQFVAKAVGDEEVVDAPAGVLLAGPETVGPPGIDVPLVRVKIAESVGEARLEQSGELGTLIAAVGFGVLQVDFLMSHVQVSADDDGFLRVERQEVGTEVVFPRHAVVQAAQFVLRVGCIDGDEVEVRHLQRDDASLLVVVFDVDAAGDAQRLVACIDSRARIPFFLGIVPVGGVAVKWQIQLAFLHFGFLQAEEVGVEPVEGFDEALVFTGAEPVHIPRDKFHNLFFSLDDRTNLRKKARFLAWLHEKQAIFCKFA